MYLQINTVKYNADWEITNIYENLQIVWSHFFTNMLLFIYIRSTLNIYWFIGIRICCQWIQTNSYWSLLTIRNIWSGIWWTNLRIKIPLFAPTYFPPLLIDTLGSCTQAFQLGIVITSAYTSHFNYICK